MVPEPLPPTGPSRIPRFTLLVKLVPVRRVPPLSTIAPGVGAAGAAPRLASEDTNKVPLLIATGPIKVLVAVNVTRPAPGRVMPAPAAPEMTPLMVSKPLFMTFRLWVASNDKGRFTD